MGLEPNKDNMHASKMNVLGYIAWSCGPAQVVALPLAIAVSVQYLFIRFISAFEKDEKETPVSLKEKEIKVIKKEDAPKQKNLENSEIEETSVSIAEDAPIRESISSPAIELLDKKERDLIEEIAPLKRPSRYKKMLEVCRKTEHLLLYGLFVPCCPFAGTGLSLSLNKRTFKQELVNLKEVALGLKYIYWD
jgi:hypothetical protein